MNVPHGIAGYDKRTETLEIDHSVPEHKSDEVRALASLADGDDGLGCYPVDSTAAIKLGLLIDRHLDPDRYEWFLEPKPVIALTT